MVFRRAIPMPLGIKVLYKEEATVAAVTAINEDSTLPCTGSCDIRESG